MVAAALIDQELLAEEAWRFNLVDYAVKMSRGLWKPYRHLVYTANIIQEALRKGRARVIIAEPPRHGKSELASRWLPTWFLDWFPEKRVILGSYGSDLASDFGRKVRDTFMNNPRTWTRVHGVSRGRSDDWLTDKNGGMRTIGVGGGITGYGGDLMLLDDAHKNWEEAMSVVKRQKVIDWFNSTFYTRAEPDASIFISQTRWHQRDLTGYLLEEHEDDWIEVRLPAIAEDGDPLGRYVGEALCSERYSVEDLERIKLAIGSQMFTGLYQQRPSVQEGNLIKRDWIRFYGGPTGITVPEVSSQMASWDMNFKETKAGSFVVGQVWCSRGANCYLLDQRRDRWDFTNTKYQVKKMAADWPNCTEKLIEEAANGPAIMSSLKNSVRGIIGVKPQGSKYARLASVAPMFEAGNVWFPHPSIAPWVLGLIEELVMFPNAEHDDQVDTLSQALNRYKSRPRFGEMKLNLDVGLQRNPWRLQ